MWRIREWLLVFSLRRWSYAWRCSRHVAVPPILYLPATMYGSMDLDAERALGTHLPAYLAAPLDPLPGWGTVASGWREQMADGLSPEALDSDVQPDPYLDPIAAEYGSEWEAEVHRPECMISDCPGCIPEDSGPGVPSLAPPGPDPGDAPYGWIGDPGAPEPAPPPTRLADTADITDARLLADVQADMRAREDGCLAFLAGFASACERVRLDLSASLA